MNNRQKLKELIDRRMNTEIRYQGAIWNQHPEQDEREASNRAEVALVEFIETLNLDPVLETWEQAARREGWVTDPKVSKIGSTISGTASFKKNGPSIVVSNDGGHGWRAVCLFYEIERQIIDNTKDVLQ